MANLQVKNVPESLHRKIRAHAKRRGRTVRDVVLDAVGSGALLHSPQHTRLKSLIRLRPLGNPCSSVAP